MGGDDGRSEPGRRRRNLQQIMTDYEPVLGRPIPNPNRRLTWRPDTRWAVVCGITVALGVLALGGTTEFLYFQF